MPATSVINLSLLPPNRRVILERGMGKACGVFSIGVVTAQSAPNPITPLTKTQPRWRSVTGRRSGDTAVTQPVSALDAALVDHGGDRTCDGFGERSMKGEESCL
jgi:hypothetical protein